MKTSDWYVKRRIACEGYPSSEALYTSVEDYVEQMEELHDAEMGIADRSNERLRSENSHLHHQTNKLGEDVLRLRAEVAALKKDAERYRWLRSSFRVARWDVKYWTGEFWDVMYGDAMDKQIDAALGRED